MNQTSATAREITNLHIQGAKAIALASLLSLKKQAQTFTGTLASFKKDFKTTADLLTKARPTEPLINNIVKFLKIRLNCYQQTDVKQAKQDIIYWLSSFESLIASGEEKIIASGKALFKPGENVLTHCHSSTVEKILIEAYQKNKFKVFNTETRPLFQGRITARNLVAAGLLVTMVADSAGPFLISVLSGKNLSMDKVIIGADAILPDGSIINKLGSFGLSLAAKTEGVPLYIAAHLLKTDDDGIIPIEIRHEEEIWQNKPKGLKIINFAFDKVPAKNITGIICEFGVIKPQQVKQLVKKYYPWILK